MSLYRFFSSDKEMPEFDSMHITPGKANNSISVIDENHALRIKTLTKAVRVLLCLKIIIILCIKID